MTDNLIKFSPFQSFVDTSFWHILSKMKLIEFKLNEGPHKLQGCYEHINKGGNSNKFIVEMNAFDKDSTKLQSNSCYLKGYIHTLNTIENFHSIDKMKFINNFGLKKILSRIENKKFLLKPDSLCLFSILSYCDLKAHKFYYWFAFPAPIFQVNPTIKFQMKSVNELFSEKQMDNFMNYFEYSQSSSKSMFFSIFLVDELIRIDDFKFFDIEDDNCFLGFCDSSNDSNYPGWPLRILLYAICTTMIKPGDIKTLKVLCYRKSLVESQFSMMSSSYFELELTGFEINCESIKFIGWEKFKDELKPKMVNLSSTMNPIMLAENAVDLNLKLMKWRLIPDLNLEVINRTKCLLLGSGTLGCNVARQLLAWNIGQITFVDNGTVSYSNPVRQSLFTFAQSSQPSTNKASAAAESIKAIYPGVKALSHNLTIPMPGHFVSNAELNSVCQQVEQLEQLIKQHDVVFLLLDTREARWLPTLLAKLHRKLVINAALGFDSYLVMRHGIPPTNSSEIPADKKKFVAASQLGCYFCTDVVGPANSTKDRTLDQQCTVTRPGVSMIAASIAVELLITLLQSEFGPETPVTLSDDYLNDPYVTSLGSAFHQMRGFMSNYSTVISHHTAYESCSACSDKVKQQYLIDKFDFLTKVFNDKSYLEDICGLSQLQQTIDFDCVTALSDCSSSD